MKGADAQRGKKGFKESRHSDWRTFGRGQGFEREEQEPKARVKREDAESSDKIIRKQTLEPLNP